MVVHVPTAVAPRPSASLAGADSARDIEEIETVVTGRVEPLARRVDVVVNYDHFSIRPELVDAYTAMVDRVTERFYRRVTRYAASGFLKARLEHRSSGEATVNPRPDDARPLQGEPR